jgi:2,4-diaminopentanoate dehydrogenase
MGKALVGPVPVVVMGLGFIGQEIAKAAHASQELELVGAVDTNPRLVGRKLGELLGDPSLGMKICAQLKDAVGRRRGVVLLHATGSRLPQVMDQLLSAIHLQLAVVSTCEELSFPYLKYGELAEQLEREAKSAAVSVLGTGVNPGFVLDRLVATAGQVCGTVRHLSATRVVDARSRREALQRKVGAGLSEDEFMQLADKDQIGHVGLTESAALSALGLGINCDDFEEELVPLIAEEDIEGGAFVVKKGRVAGISQTALGMEGAQERVRLALTIAMGVENPRDQIVIDAEPRVELEIKGGIAGDRATANVVVNAAPRVASAEPGLLTVLELPAGR